MKKIIRRSFGRGPNISLFTLGTMRANDSHKEMFEVIKSAVTAGINHIETSPSYGSAETLIGKSLRSLAEKGFIPQGGWVITSKILPCIELEEGKQRLKKMLKRLGIKRLDNLAIHGLNLPEHLEWAINGEGADLLNWAQQSNLVGQIGFSSHGSNALIQKALDSKCFQSCSLHLHLFDPERIPIAQKALSKGIGVMAISPADKGGQLHRPSKVLIDDCRPFSPLELAYRFLISKGISSLTIGASRPSDLQLVKQLMNNNQDLSYNEKNAIHQLKINKRKRLGITLCEQCRKCIPCPQNIPIPQLLRLRNLAIGHEMFSFAKERYSLIGKAGHWWEEIDASACKDCGECLPQCPNQLPIPELLSETHMLLKGGQKRRLWD